MLYSRSRIVSGNYQALALQDQPAIGDESVTFFLNHRAHFVRDPGKSEQAARPIGDVAWRYSVADLSDAFDRRANFFGSHVLDFPGGLPEIRPVSYRSV